MNIATLPTGKIVYIETPIATVKPSQQRISDLNTLILSLVHTHHPEWTEPIDAPYQDMNQTNICSEVILIYL